MNPHRNENSILENHQLKFFYEKILLYYESDRSSYGSADILDRKVKKDERFKQFSFVYKDYLNAMANPQDDTFYFCADIKEGIQGKLKKKRKVTYNQIVKKWFSHIRNAFAHNYIEIDGGALIMRDYLENKQTLYVRLTYFELFEELVAFVKEKITEEISNKNTKTRKL